MAHVVDKRMEEKQKIDDVPIVRDFSKVFLEDLPSLTPDREIEFEIDLVPRIEPILNASYRMAPAELKNFTNDYRSC